MAAKVKAAAQSVTFRFGKNWQRFIKTLAQDRITDAQRSLKDMFGIDDFSGKSFLDIGSGSGLFSLAARRLGARVYSFDYDPQSVDCTKELRRRYSVNDAHWIIEEGSELIVTDNVDGYIRPPEKTGGKSACKVLWRMQPAKR